MATYLRMYLSPLVRSIFACQLSDPSYYQEALQALRSKYGHPALVAKANINALSNPPPVKADDFRSSEKFEGCLNGVIPSLLKGGHSQELNSILVMEHVLSKLPTSLRREWGHEFVRFRRSTGLLDFQKWLRERIVGKRLAALQRPPAPEQSRRRHKSARPTVFATTATEIRKCLICKGSPHVEPCH